MFSATLKKGLKWFLNSPNEGEKKLSKSELVAISELNYLKLTLNLKRLSEHILAYVFQDGPVAQWIRHLTTNQGIPGSNPGGVVHFWIKNLLKRRFAITVSTEFFTLSGDKLVVQNSRERVDFKQQILALLIVHHSQLVWHKICSHFAIS